MAMTPWPLVPLAQIATLTGGGTPSRTRPEFFEGNIPWLTGQDIPEDTVVHVAAGRESITEGAVRGSATSVVPEGSVLVTTRVTVGKVAVAARPLCFSQDVTALLFKNRELVDPFFVAYILLSQRERVLGWNQGSTIAGITREALGKLQIPLPSLSEQRRIVEIMQEAETVRRLRAEASDKTADLTPSIFHDMFGDPATNSKRYRCCRIAEVVVSCDYGCSTKANDNGRGLPMLRMNNVTFTGELDLTDLKHVELSDEEVTKYELMVGDVLFNRTNSRDLVGKTGLWDGRYPAVAASYFIRVRVDGASVLPEYFVAYMNQPAMKKRLRDISKGAVGQSNINAKDLQSLSILVPPMPEQEHFRSMLQAVSALRSVDCTGSGREQALVQGLLAHALAGDLTAKWRSRHNTELGREIAERDAALHEAGVTLRKPVARKPRREVAEDSRLAELTEQQLMLALDLQDLWRDGEQQVFTPKTLAMVASDPEMRHNPDLVRRHLDVLAARGFVIRVSRQEQQRISERESFAVFYRRVRLAGDAFDPGDVPELEHVVDDVRADALNRMAARLKERT